MEAAPDSTRQPESNLGDAPDAVATAPLPTVRPGRWWSGRRRWGGISVPVPAVVCVWALGFVAAVALLASTAGGLTTNPGVSIFESDTATPVLEAQSILHGQVLLNGWRMLYDSFWSVEVPFYVVGVAVTGVSPVLLYVVPAVLAVLLLTTAALMARQGLRGGAAAAAVGTVIALIGLPSDVWATLLLHGAWHVGTMLWCLLAFLGLRSGRWGAGWWVAVVLLTAGLIGDLQTVAYGVGAVAVAGVIATIRTRRWLGGAAALSAAAASVVGAILLRKLLAAWGAWVIGNINAPASHDQRWKNLGNLPEWLPRVFGVGTGDWGHNGVPAALTAVRWLAALAVVLAVLVALGSMLAGLVWPAGPRGKDRPRRTGGEAWRIDDMLLLAALADLAFYVYAAQSDLPGYLRYLAPFVVFGSILAARQAGRAYAALRSGLPRRAVAAAGGLVTALFAAAFLVTAVQPTRPLTNADLATFLADHDLTNGVGAYWTAAMTTVASSDQVRVRPVVLHDDHLVRYGRQSSAAWYADQKFEFLVFDSTDNWGGINLESVTLALGPPEHVYQIGTFRVVVWPTPTYIDPAAVAG